MHNAQVTGANEYPTAANCEYYTLQWAACVSASSSTCGWTGRNKTWSANRSLFERTT